MQTVNTRFLTSTALLTALLCILGPVSVPIGPVPVSLTNLVIYLMVYLLDTKRAAAAYLLYMLLGLAGLPVFSGFTGGVGKLLGPTGGYIIGFLPMTVLIALLVERHHENRLLCVLVLEAATWIPYEGPVIASANQLVINGGEFTVYGIRYNRSAEGIYPLTANLCNSNGMPAISFIDLK